MYRKLSLSCILLFCCIIISDVSPSYKPTLPTPVFDFTKANHPGKKNKLTAIPFWETGKKKDIAADTAALKQSNWYADAIKNIEASEYEIKKDDKTGSYCGPNRQHQLRASFTYNSFTLKPRSEEQDWTLRMQLSGIYADKKLIAKPGENDLPVIGSNKIVFNNDNFSTEYINSKEGVRQNFIIQKEPASKPQTINIRLQTNKSWYINKVHDRELHFARLEGDQLSKKITYNSLKVWDANNKELTAKFVVNKKHTAFEIEVNAKNAVYPITIDPLSTGTAGTPDWIGDDANQAYASFGFSVASAGDVNSDGFSDVIIGAYKFDDGANTDEGRAFVYHGSATGLSATPNSTPDDADQFGAEFGWSVASAGDVNGDGFSDVIIGAYKFDDGANTNEGRAFVYYGSATGLSATPDSTPDDADQFSAQFGYSVASAGDVNGDGYADVIIGAHAYDDLANTDEGRAFIYHGSATGLSATPNSTPDDADQASCQFGHSVASAGDINGDGYSDVIIGANGYNDGANNDEGRAFVYHGSASGLSATPNSIPDDADQAFAIFGWSVASAGDVNGDGYSDVVIGAYQSGSGFAPPGRAFVYYGSASSLSATPDRILDDAPANSSSAFGYSVASAGDVNGDGYSDVIVGAPSYNDGANTDEGRAFVYYGSASGLSTTPISTPDDADQFAAQFGISLAAAGDVNGDGYSDVIIGAFYYDNGANTYEGRAFVYHGSPDGLSASPVNTPDDADQGNARLGWSVASAGDVNGDGYSDIIIGAPYYDDGPNIDEGRAFVYYGSATGLPSTPSNTPDDADQNGAFFGHRVACAGDVNGDGYSDIIIGAPYYNDAGNTNEGRAFVYYGSPTGLPATPSNTPDDADKLDAQFGISVASAGDVNGDGYGDVIIGASQYDDGGNNEEGRAFIYLGSSSGLSATYASSPDDADQATAYFGVSVASAGDVNGDGYSDVIIGAYGYSDGANIDEGRAFVYYGSSSGISASPNVVLDYADQLNAYFGWCVASAGDVNGDGYSDVIIGAPNYDDGGNNDEGRAFVYYGSMSGLPVTPGSILDDADQAIATFGFFVASAGDVNGDGYSDVIIGAPLHTDPVHSWEGWSYVYHGSATGLSATPNNIPDDANNVNAFFGNSVASAGDINGDGYSDVIIGAPYYTEGANTYEGRAFVYYGNNTGGLRNNLRLYNQDLVTPIQQLNVTEPNLFGAGLFAKSPFGRVKGKLVWEVKSESGKFSGNPITNSTSYLGKQPSFTDLGIAGTELKYNVQKVGSKSNKIRTRVEYDKVTAITGQVYGPWRYPAGYTMGAYGMNSVPLPVKLSSFNGSLIVDKVTLQWSSSDDEYVSAYQIERSSNNSNFTAIGISNSVHQNNKTYHFTDNHPLKGTSWYRLKITDEYNRINYSKTIVIKNTNDAVWVYPTVLNKAENISLQFKNSFTGIVEIQLVNMSGATVFKKAMTTNGNVLPIDLPSLSSGVYILSAMQNGERIIIQKIVIR